MSTLTVGLIGLGAFGEAIGRRLLREGFPPMVFDVASGPLRYFVMKHGADMATSPHMIAEMCNVVITVLPSSEAARDAVFGTYGLADGLREGTVLIEMGHSVAGVVPDAVERLAARGTALLEAPARGTPVDAKNGKLTIPVAGDTAAAERVMPVLKALGDKVVPTGSIGSGAVLAALAGAVRAAATLAAAEALVAGERAGVAPAALLEFCAGQGTLGAAIVEALKPRDEPLSLVATHTIGAVLDELDAALARARAEGLALRQMELCRELWAALKDSRGPDDDHATIVRWLGTAAVPPKPEPGA